MGRGSAIRARLSSGTPSVSTGGAGVRCGRRGGDAHGRVPLRFFRAHRRRSHKRSVSVPNSLGRPRGTRRDRPWAFEASPSWCGLGHAVTVPVPIARRQGGDGHRGEARRPYAASQKSPSTTGLRGATRTSLRYAVGVSWTEAETVRRWIAGDRGRDPWWTLDALIKRHMGEDCVPLDDFAEVLGVPRDVVVALAQRAHADTLRSMDGAREFSRHEAAWLRQRAANLRVLCRLPGLEHADPAR